ncbi:hypothetical protein BV53_05805 [Candidatus Synechococcus spongiarum LMB bulk15N]|uniref:Uncharacterized protein n=1 Tax=Candidatus Synechococcus spongiarum LMB bulk15N TaxID=1943583 RepID=A0A1T1D104_9SYNE|nr:hypothetical protein BV53_05805 [Candidatus Synechococcus spongiarum LMB bulk15N]
MPEEIQQDSSDWEIEEKQKQGEHERTMETMRFLGTWILLLIVVIMSAFKQEWAPVVSASLLSSLAVGMLGQGRKR